MVFTRGGSYGVQIQVYNCGNPGLWCEHGLAGDQEVLEDLAGAGSISGSHQ